jgi:histidyl-tRNA synthetase
MLVGERGEEKTDVIVVVEDDQYLALSIAALSKLRSVGLTAEMIASGSPRKRFDKAKGRSKGIVSFAAFNGELVRNVRGYELPQQRIEEALDSD